MCRRLDREPGKDSLKVAFSHRPARGVGGSLGTVSYNTSQSEIIARTNLLK